MTPWRLDEYFEQCSDLLHLDRISLLVLIFCGQKANYKWRSRQADMPLVQVICSLLLTDNIFCVCDDMQTIVSLRFLSF